MDNNNSKTEYLFSAPPEYNKEQYKPIDPDSMGFEGEEGIDHED